MSTFKTKIELETRTKFGLKDKVEGSYHTFFWHVGNFARYGNLCNMFDLRHFDLRSKLTNLSKQTRHIKIILA